MHLDINLVFLKIPAFDYSLFYIYLEKSRNYYVFHNWYFIVYHTMEMLEKYKNLEIIAIRSKRNIFHQHSSWWLNHEHVTNYIQYLRYRSTTALSVIQLHRLSYIFLSVASCKCHSHNYKQLPIIRDNNRFFDAMRVDETCLLRPIPPVTWYAPLFSRQRHLHVALSTTYYIIYSVV